MSITLSTTCGSDDTVLYVSALFPAADGPNQVNNVGIALIDSERIHVRVNGGNQWIVDRGWAGTNKAAHTSSTVVYPEVEVDTTQVGDSDTTAKGSEVTYLTGTVAGTGSAASKAVVLDANRAYAFYPKSTLGTDNAAGILISSPNSSESFFQNTANDKRSYLLRVQAYRPSTLPMGNGVNGVDDAAIFGLYRSYAADAAYCQQRGLNVSVNHRGTTAGSIGNNIGTNASTSTALAGDCVTLTCVNENYAPSTAGVSGVVDLVHLHEGANSTTAEFGLRIRNQKKNGSQTGAAIRVQNDVVGTAHASVKFFKYGLDLSGLAATAQNASDGLGTLGVSTAKGDIVLGSTDANGLPAIIASGAATNDGEIVTQVGADTLWADGSLYISVVDGAGTLWQKKNDVWTANA